MFKIDIETWNKSLEKAHFALKDKIPAQKRDSSIRWQTEKEQKLQRELIFCLITPRTDQKYLEKIYPIIDDFDFGNYKESSFLELLRENKITFPKKKEKSVAEFLQNKTNLKELLKTLAGLINEGIVGERRIRNVLIFEISGLGYKTCSLFLMGIGFCSYLAILDSRNFNFMKEMRLIPENLELNKLQDDKIYETLENWENELAKKLNISVFTLDGIICDYEK